MRRKRNDQHHGRACRGPRQGGRARWQRRLQRLRRSPLPLCGRACALQSRQRAMPRTRGSSAASSQSAGRTCSHRKEAHDTTSLGRFVKEFCRMLGLPDLAARRENPDIEGLGVWCALQYFHERPPPASERWAKEKLGWIKPALSTRRSFKSWYLHRSKIHRKSASRSWSGLTVPSISSSRIVLARDLTRNCQGKAS